jgi:hypothetical protein
MLATFRPNPEQSLQSALEIMRCSLFFNLADARVPQTVAFADALKIASHHLKKRPSPNEHAWCLFFQSVYHFQLGETNAANRLLSVRHNGSAQR